ncbi:MAG: HAD-IA family hydrolase [Quisquiliibacterium sp.]
MTEQAIAAVIWDFGGVISASPFEAFASYERANGLPHGFIRSVNTHNPLDNAWARLERNQCGPAEFDALFAAESAALGHEVRGGEVLALLDGAIRPEMIEALRRIRVRLKTGCITNNFAIDAVGAPPASDKSAIMALFDHVIESAKAGVRKPDPRIYLMMTQALGVPPQACVYLDDLGINLKPARALGMRTIKVGDPGPALAELQEMLGFALVG